MPPRPATPCRFPWTAAILVFAAASRLAYLLAYRDDPFCSRLVHDARRYHDWAVAFAAGRNFETGAFSQAPLYPWLVGLLYRLTGPSPGAVYLVQALLGIATIALLARVARRVYGQAAGPWAAGIAAMSGTLVFYESKLLPAALTTLLAVLFVDRLLDADASDRLSAWALPGLVLGVAGVTNPALLLAGPPALVWIGRSTTRSLRDRAVSAAIFSAAAILVVLPVTLRNRAVSGEWVLVATNGGITFWQGNNPAAVGVFATPAGFSGSIRTQREEALTLAEAEAGRPLTDARASSFWFRRGLAFLAAEPARAGRLFGSKLALALSSREQPLEYDPNLDENRWRLLFLAPFGAVLGLAAVRPLARAGNPRAEGAIALVAAAVFAVLVVFYVSSRYRLPVLALLCLPAGAGAALIAERLRQGLARARLPVALAFAIAAASLALGEFAFTDLRRVQTAMALGDRGGVLRASGDLQGSIATYRRALQLDTRYPYLHLDLGKSLRADGRRDEAERSIREALRLAPDLAEGWLDLGVVLYEADRLVEAEAAFARAFALDPGDGAAANNLAGTRVRLGNLAGARAVLLDMRARGLRADPAIERFTAIP